MNFNFKKKFGQNFLKEKNVINRIAWSISPNEDDLIIEIGPGAGALTSVLVKYNANLICYEIDTDTHEYLDKLLNDKTKVIYGDFLKSDVVNDIKDIKFNKLYIIGNLPYYITTPIIMRILELNLDVQEMVFMVQKEVAERFSAKYGSRDYGSITVFLNYYYNIEKLFVVGRNNFVPAPNVDSEVIKFVKKEKEVLNINDFNKIVKASFQMKRKNLRNNLRSFDLDKIDNILKKYGYDLTNRAEDLPYEIFVKLTKEYFN